jgi:hypothetical protein
VLPVLATISYLLITLGARSLWLDEAWVALSVVKGQSDPSALNTLPIAFFALLEASARVLGPSEIGLRFPSLVLFALGIGATAVLARYMYGRALEGMLAGLFLATDYAAVTYAREVKPYTADIFFAALIPVLALAVETRSTLRWWIIYGVALSIGPLFSFTSLLVATSSAVYLLLPSVFPRPLPRSRRLLIWFATHAIAGCFVGAYVLIFARSQRTDGLLSYWKSGFPPADGFFSVLAWSVHEYLRLFPVFFTSVAVSSVGDRIVQITAVVLVVSGCARLARWRAAYLVLLLGPAALLLPAALLHMYPFDPGLGGRLILYVLPAVSVLMAGALGAAIRWNGRLDWQRRAIATGAVLVALTFVGRGLYGVLADPEYAIVPKEELRDLIATDLVPNLQAGDAIYVYYGAVDAFEYYAPQFRADMPDQETNLSLTNRNGIHLAYGSAYWETPHNYGPEIISVVRQTGSKRVWIVLSHVWPGDELALTRSVRQCGSIGQVWRQPGAALYLIDASVSASLGPCSTRG